MYQSVSATVFEGSPSTMLAVTDSRRLDLAHSFSRNNVSSGPGRGLDHDLWCLNKASMTRTTTTIFPRSYLLFHSAISMHYYQPFLNQYVLTLDYPYSCKSCREELEIHISLAIMLICHLGRHRSLVMACINLVASSVDRTASTFANPTKEIC